MRQAGRYLASYRALRRNYPSFLDFCYHPKASAEATIQPLRQFDFDAAIHFSDILVIADSLMRGLEYTGEGPKLCPLTVEEPAMLLADFNLEQQKKHLQAVYASQELICQSLPKNKVLIGFAGAPWTLCCYMIDGSGGAFQRTRSWAEDHQSSIDQLMELLVSAV
ncbi:MAG: uroporphyrinogen decarboxylase family protein, partial [Pseudomonadota bacterium]